jgi:hypothetical protein
MCESSVRGGCQADAGTAWIVLVSTASRTFSGPARWPGLLIPATTNFALRGASTMPSLRPSGSRPKRRARASTAFSDPGCLDLPRRGCSFSRLSLMYFYSGQLMQFYSGLERCRSSRAGHGLSARL